MNRIIRRILVLVLFVTNGSTFAGSIAEYVNVVDPKTSITIETQPDRFALVDVASDAVTCGPKDKLICFRSKGFQFAVPRSLSDGATWTLDGVKYKVSKRMKSSIMGKKGPFWLIEQNSEHPLWFVYSYASGLVMLGGLVESGSSVFVLVQSCGFGASVDCHQ